MGPICLNKSKNVMAIKAYKASAKRKDSEEMTGSDSAEELKREKFVR